MSDPPKGLPVTPYENCDIIHGVPAGFDHVPGKRLALLCRRHRIKFAPALGGFDGDRRYGYKPVLDGVVVRKRTAQRLQKLIEERKARSRVSTPAQRRAAKQCRQKRDTDRFLAELTFRFPSCPTDEARKIARRATEIGSGRVGRSRTADDAVKAAVVAHIRHEHTDYDAILDEFAVARRAEFAEMRDRVYRPYWGERDDARAGDPAEARDAVSAEISAVLQRWQSPSLALAIRPLMALVRNQDSNLS